jgi:hypothetical protein
LTPFWTVRTPETELPAATSTDPDATAGTTFDPPSAATLTLMCRSAKAPIDSPYHTGANCTFSTALPSLCY